MKTGKNSLLRMENLINNDRMKRADGFLDLLTGDIDKVLKDYFDYKGYPQVEVVKYGNTFTVKMVLAADGIRSFSSMPR